MRFGLGTYFGKLDISEAIGHEMAEVASRGEGKIGGRDLPFRSLIDDPFDFRRRAVLPGDHDFDVAPGEGGGSFLLH